MHDDIRPDKIPFKRWFKNKKYKFYHKLTRDNNTEATKDWENVAQTRLGAEFRACYVIVHETS